MREQARAAEEAAKQHAEQVRAEVAAPIVAAAGSALSDWQDADTAEQATGERARAASWFGKRRARTDHADAQAARARQARQQLTDDWGAACRDGTSAPRRGWIASRRG